MRYLTINIATLSNKIIDKFVANIKFLNYNFLCHCFCSLKKCSLIISFLKYKSFLGHLKAEDIITLKINNIDFFKMTVSVLYKIVVFQHVDVGH